MIKLLDIYLCGITVLIELIAVMSLALLIQFIVYKITGISLYTKICKALDKLDKKINQIF